MMRGYRHFSITLVLLAAACGGSTPPAEDASDATPVIPEKTVVEAPPLDEAEPKSSDSAPPKKEEVAEPAFTPDMSVEEAIKAVPPSVERLNVDQETMSKPFEDGAAFESCKAGSAHFKLRVAVWRGKAVGIDLTTTPKNPKLAECLKGRLRELTWPAKVPSLNTVEYAM